MTTIRLAGPEDIPAITRIYNLGIEDGGTLETEHRTEAERLQWLQRRGPRHPVTVAEVDGVVRGWASLNPFSLREAYRFVADLSVYVDREARGLGIGYALMQDLPDRARALGYRKLVLTTFTTSTAALHLYAKCGYRHVGDYLQQGLLDNQWMDTRIMELLL